MKKLLIVDGYNYIFNTLKGEKVSGEKLSFLRQKLAGYLEQYSGLTGIDTILVFDSSDETGSKKQEMQGSIKIIYSGRESADSVIEKLVASKHGTKEIFVVTSDYLQQKTILKKNTYRKSAREFNIELTKTVEDMREDIKKENLLSVSGFYNLERRLGKDSRKSLKRLQDL